MEGSFENTFNALSINDQIDQLDREFEQSVDGLPEPINADDSTNIDLNIVDLNTIDLNTINFDTIDCNEEKEFQTVKTRKPKNQVRRTKLETDVIPDDVSTDQSLTHSFKLSNIVNNTSHYLELAKEGINCMCSKALRNIQARQDKIASGTWSMNILGPMFCNDFYVRFDSKKYALVKEEVVRTGKIELDGKEYPINSQDSIRIWDLICGPNDRPTLFKDNNMLSLGEKLQDIIQANVRRDLIADGHLRPEDKYTPTVWLFLAYRYNFKEQQKPCRFINMCWNSDGSAPKSLIKVSEYYVRNSKPRSNDRQYERRQPDNRQTDRRPRDQYRSNNRQTDNRQANIPRFKPFTDDKKIKSTDHGKL